MRKSILALTACLAWAGNAVSAAPAAPAPGDWAAYGHDAAATRYSPLTQITPANVGKLQVAWTYHMNPAPKSDEDPSLLPTSTTTPLVVDGLMYLGTPYGRVVALEPTSGQSVWEYVLPGGDQPAKRGVSYWPGDAHHAARLIVATLRARLIALDARTGAPQQDFGAAGVLDTKTPAIMNGLPNALYSYSAPPAIYRNLIITGSRLQESPVRGPSGDARAWDVISGKLVWTFHSIPREGEKFHDTWADDSGRERSGVNEWNMATVDTERGIVYLGFSAPTLDRYGGDRKGNNLFSDSVVALRARDGKYLWHFQLVHHDLWDLDMPAAPALLTVHKDGRAIPALAAINKSALLFLLNRVTGKPIFGVTEKPVPASSISTELASPTQPFPDKPGIVTRMSFDPTEVADVTPELHAVCQGLIDKGNLAGTRVYEPLRTDRTSVRFPGGEGGVEWGGGAFDPQRGLFLFTNTQLGLMEKLVHNANGTWSNTSARFADPKTRSPCQQPPWGELIAVNVNTGEVAWRSILGITDSFPEGKRHTGRPANAGPTVTAGGVTFIGATDDQRFRAFDTQTGRELWTYRLDFSAHATPMTYQGRDGRQYVVIVATGGSYLGSPAGGDSVLAFALPP